MIWTRENQRVVRTAKPPHTQTLCHRMFMSWQPIPIDELRTLIAKQCEGLTAPHAILWRWISIEPEKWTQQPWGDQGGGFWVGALLGSQCLYFNDIEYGWNSSPWKQYGRIEEYWCNQDELSHILSRMLNGLEEA